MKIIKIDKSDWTAGMERLRKSYRLFGPVREKDYFLFKPLKDGQMPETEYFNARLSPKSIVYPQSQILFSYSTDPSGEDQGIFTEHLPDSAPGAVIGIRPCDAAAFPLVRRNFETDEYKDPYWLNAYKAMTFVGLACNLPDATCFCTSSGGGPFNEDGLDVLLADNGEAFLAKTLTEKGKNLLDAAGWNTPEAEAGEQIKTMKADAEARITSHVSTDKLRRKTTLPLYDAPFWKNEAFACINCGTCTYSCPTCWCFDIQDETYGKSGVRIRNWDSCMSPLFTVHASGHNPRPEKYERVRQRFMHKLKYYVDKYDKGIQCVGCGRCVRLCPVNIDIRRIATLMNEYDENACACETA